MPTPPVSPARFSIPPLGRAWRSLVCMLGGWLVLVLWLLLRYAEFAATHDRWYGVPLVTGWYSLYYAAPVWLLVVLPLFLLVPHRSGFWSFRVVVPLFALLGFVVMRPSSPFYYDLAANRLAYQAALFAAAAGLFSAVWQKRLARRLPPPPGTREALP